MRRGGREGSFLERVQLGAMAPGRWKVAAEGKEQSWPNTSRFPFSELLAQSRYALLSTPARTLLVPRLALGCPSMKLNSAVNVLVSALLII